MPIDDPALLNVDRLEARRDPLTDARRAVEAQKAARAVEFKASMRVERRRERGAMSPRERIERIARSPEVRALLDARDFRGALLACLDELDHREIEHEIPARWRHDPAALAVANEASVDRGSDGFYAAAPIGRIAGPFPTFVEAECAALAHNAARGEPPELEELAKVATPGAGVRLLEAFVPVAQAAGLEAIVKELGDAGWTQPRRVKQALEVSEYSPQAGRLVLDALVRELEALAGARDRIETARRRVAELRAAGARLAPRAPAPGRRGATTDDDDED